MTKVLNVHVGKWHNETLLFLVNICWYEKWRQKLKKEKPTFINVQWSLSVSATWFIPVFSTHSCTKWWTSLRYSHTSIRCASRCFPSFTHFALLNFGCPFPLAYFHCPDNSLSISDNVWFMRKPLLYFLKKKKRKEKIKKNNL